MKPVFEGDATLEQLLLFMLYWTDSIITSYDSCWLKRSLITMWTHARHTHVRARVHVHLLIANKLVSFPRSHTSQPYFHLVHHIFNNSCFLHVHAMHTTTSPFLMYNILPGCASETMLPLETVSILEIIKGEMNGWTLTYFCLLRILMNVHLNIFLSSFFTPEWCADRLSVCIGMQICSDARLVAGWSRSSSPDPIVWRMF